MAEFPRRHAPATLRLKELIATRLGQPRLLFCHQRSVADTPGRSAAGRWPRPSGHARTWSNWSIGAATWSTASRPG